MNVRMKSFLDTFISLSSLTLKSFSRHILNEGSQTGIHCLPGYHHPRKHIHMKRRPNTSHSTRTDALSQQSIRIHHASTPDSFTHDSMLYMLPTNHTTLGNNSSHVRVADRSQGEVAG